MKTRKIIWAAVASLFLLLQFPVPAAAGDPGAGPLIERGRFELDDGHPDVALDFLDRGLVLNPTDLNGQVTRGQALMQLERFDEAEEQFKKIIPQGLDAKKAAYVELGGLYGRLGRYLQAIQAYSQALALLPDRADLYLARGAMSMELRDFNRAEADFGQAAVLDKVLAPSASFHLAISSYRQENFPETLARIEKTRTFPLDAQFTQQLDQFEKMVRDEEWARKPWALNLTLLGEYDDNVFMKPLDGYGPDAYYAGTRDKADWNFGLGAGGTYYFLNQRNVQTGLSYSFNGRKYETLHENNTTSHTGGIFLALSENPVYFQLRGNYSHYIADKSSKMDVWAVSPTLSLILCPRAMTMIHGSAEYHRKYDKTDDAFYYVGGITQYLTIIPSPSRDMIGLTARVGAWATFEEPAGGDRGARYRMYELKGGLSFPLLLGFDGDVEGAYASTTFDPNINIDPEKKRRDKRTQVTAKLGRSLGKFLRAEFQWVYTYNDSNLNNKYGQDIYGFKKNVYTILLSAAF
ncbi:MAG: tetratricopeptide repeat protein [Pseudomonadota bacterium]